MTAATNINKSSFAGIKKSLIFAAASVGLITGVSVGCMGLPITATATAAITAAGIAYSTASCCLRKQIKPIVPPPSLETEFRSQICIPVDIHAPWHLEYLSPNEGRPTGIQSHLDRVVAPDQSLLIVTGTERVIFDTIIGNFQGVVGRDLNPRAKAYLDFVILLGRISSCRKKFVELAERPCDYEEMQKRIDGIRSKIASSDIPDFMKKYYLAHIGDFSAIFYREPGVWRRLRYANCFPGVQYYYDNRLFTKFQRYAKEGRIISTIGDINDLRPFAHRRIAAIDTSNICDYTFIDIQGCPKQQPRIIWTIQDLQKTSFYSYIHQELTPEERHELDGLMAEIQKNEKKQITAHWLTNEIFRRVAPFQSDPLNRNNAAFYCRDTLIKLKTYFEQQIKPHFMKYDELMMDFGAL